ncbi:LytR/AlgR family response regulator transcription factor [Aureibacter tunicatorum]|uniref:DNA-binding LytR/AlgR family response regulator n=1 Tax=Aureibacter tunicatorum TaxID=866807 RepID=A0AAE3XQQ0_9BACT|nr:LytTR family DNA-binding domain-containing protein [Aureibacter tunicatorum]MDR6240284.1 DNA-binding LytR/AlgR family response regulator [Aureibacter tunicatorum]BDD05835.1 DNA-binding response regulator [Aureibacter tunicatorum]
MKKIKCIIIDDEPIAVSYLADYVSKISELELVGTFHRAREAYDLIVAGEVDLLFLDIQMPEVSGLDFLRTLPSSPQVILTTAYSEYALESYELEVADYLLKPIGFKRFADAVGKVRNRLNAQIKDASNFSKYIFLKSGYKSIKVDVCNITFVESFGVYVTFNHKDGRSFVKNERLKNVEEHLVSSGFLRVHKSYLINLDLIEAVYGNTIEIGGKEIPIGRSYKSTIKELIDSD